MMRKKRISMNVVHFFWKGKNVSFKRATTAMSAEFFGPASWGPSLGKRGERELREEEEEKKGNAPHRAHSAELAVFFLLGPNVIELDPLF